MNEPIVVLHLASVTWLAACPGPGDEGLVDDEIGETGGTEVETGDGDGEGCHSDLPPLGPFQSAVEFTEDIDAPETATLCPDVGLLLGIENFSVGPLSLQIIRPGDENGEWPQGRFPLLAFAHGNGQLASGYEHLWMDIVPRGIVVMNLADVGLNLDSEPERRAARMLCALRWMQTQWPEAEQRLGCSLGLAGHSNGAHGTYLVAKHLVGHPEDPAASMDLAVLIGLAPKSVGTMDFFPAELAPPYVALQGSIDNDVPGGAIRTYDIHTPEEEGIGGTPDKYLIWAYDVEHDAFGGGDSFPSDSNTKVSATEVYPGITEAEAEEKGRVFATQYVSAAVRRFLLGDVSARQVLRGEVIPKELTPTQWWDYLPANPDGRPMIFTSFVPSLRTSPTSRFPIDLMTRNTLGSVSPSSEGRAVSVEGFASSDAVIQGWSNDLILDDRHLAQSLRIQWSEGDDGSVAWDLRGLPLSQYTHLSLRVANATNVIGMPSPNAACMVLPPFVPAMAFDVEFEGLDQASELLPITDYGFLPAQDFLVVDSAGFGIPTCFNSTFMQTVRIPLGDVCEDLELDQILALRLRFGAAHGNAEGQILLDSLELHRDPELPAPCG
jgi:hypothetical protein